MNISIDFDDTYTRDPEMWNAFIRLAQASGHKVYCVTARSWREDEQVLGTVGNVVGRENCFLHCTPRQEGFYECTGHYHSRMDRRYA